MEIKEILHKYSSKRSFKNEIRSLLKRADAREREREREREIADIIYLMRRISLVCVLSIVIDVKK